MLSPSIKSNILTTIILYDHQYWVFEPDVFVADSFITVDDKEI